MMWDSEMTKGMALEVMGHDPAKLRARSAQLRNEIMTEVERGEAYLERVKKAVLAGDTHDVLGDFNFWGLEADLVMLAAIAVLLHANEG